LRDLVEKAGKESLTPEFEEVLCDRPYTAVEEIEADQTAATIFKESGYEPGALTEVLKMMRENRTDERLSKLLEIHPLHSQRMEVAFP
jgi:predicted Zn-dependent protease